MSLMRMFLGAVLGLTLTTLAQAQPSTPSDNAQQSGVPTASIAPMLENVLPAVVNISVHGVAAMESHPLMNDPFFRRFFGEEGMPEQQEFQAAGSGVIVDPENGYIITSAHVLEQADKILVTLNSGEQLPAELVGSDPGTDIAVIRVEPQEGVQLQGLPWADASQLRVGDFVAAVGNPFGLNQTVTTGVISALGRTGLGVQGYEDFIQTDASINPGHSGGALVNMNGELIGINSAILSPGGGNIGIGFAIPVSMAEVVFQQLVEHGTVRRGQLGILAQDLNASLAKTLQTEAKQGAVIAEVEPGSPAAAAGLQAGDVVVAVNGAEITGAGELRTRIGMKELGEEVDITVDREGKRFQRRITVTDLATTE